MDDTLLFDDSYTFSLVLEIFTLACMLQERKTRCPCRTFLRGIFPTWASEVLLQAFAFVQINQMLHRLIKNGDSDYTSLVPAGRLDSGGI